MSKSPTNTTEPYMMIKVTDLQMPLSSEWLEALFDKIREEAGVESAIIYNVPSTLELDVR